MKIDNQLYEAVCRFVKSAKTTTVPTLQKQFGVDYITARRAVEEMLSKRFVEYKGGLEYRYFDPATDPKTIELKRKIAESNDLDPLFEKAVRMCAEKGEASTQIIQGVDSNVMFVQATKIASQMEKMGLCSERGDNNLRQMFVTFEQVEFIFAPEPPMPDPQEVLEIAKKKFEREVNVSDEKADPSMTIEELIEKLNSDDEEQSEKEDEIAFADDLFGDDDDDIYDDDELDEVDEEEVRRTIEESVENYKRKNANDAETASAQAEEIEKSDDFDEEEWKRTVEQGHAEIDSTIEEFKRKIAADIEAAKAGTNTHVAATEEKPEAATAQAEETEKPEDFDEEEWKRTVEKGHAEIDSTIEEFKRKIAADIEAAKAKQTEAAEAKEEQSAKEEPEPQRPEWQKIDLRLLAEPPLWTTDDKASALNAQIERIVRIDSSMDLYDAMDVADDLMRWAKYRGDDDAEHFMYALSFMLKTMTLEDFYAIRSRVHGFDTSGGYRFDVVFVVDSTGLCALAKKLVGGIGEFDRKLNKAMEEAGCHFNDLRVRTVYFGDYAEDSNAVDSHGFYGMPEEREQFKRAFCNKYAIKHGTGKALNALEALYVAMKSDFAPIKFTEKGRQIIVLLTEKYPLGLGERRGTIGYKDEYPSNVRELEQIWETPSADGMGGLSPRHARLILFVPGGDDGNGHSWSDVANFYRTSVTHLDEENRLGKEIDIDTIVAEILRS